MLRRDRNKRQQKTADEDALPRAAAYPNIGMVGGVPLTVTAMDRAVGQVIDSAQGVTCRSSFRLTNAYCIAVANSDPRYLALLRESGTNLPDGMPLVWVLRITRSGRRACRVRGPSLFEQVLDHGRVCNIRHYFVGVTDPVLQELRRRVEQRYPGILISGSYAPEFAPVSDEMVDAVSENIGQEPVDIVWVGMGTPKQDFMAQRLTERRGVTAIGIGAAFDFIAGSQKEAPKWVQKSGFEWLYRLISEPARLWRRYTIGNVQFIGAVIAHARRSR